jgi:glycyl-tRNA synthetase alpha subunit
LLLSDEARLNKFLENDDNRERITQRPLFFSYLQQMAKINQQIRLIQSDEGRSNDSKNREILQLNDMKRKMAEEFLDATNFLQTSL